MYSLFYYTDLAFTRSAGPVGFDIFLMYCYDISRQLNRR